MRKYLTEKIDAIIEERIEAASELSQHRLNTKNIVMMLLSDKFVNDKDFEELAPKYKVSKDEIREYILQKLKNATLV